MRRKRTEFWHRITEPIVGNEIVAVLEDGTTVQGEVYCPIEGGFVVVLNGDGDSTVVWYNDVDHLEGLWSETPAEFLEATDQ